MIYTHGRNSSSAPFRAQANPLQGSPKIFYRIACVPPDSCYVIARPDTILATHDGGATWSSHVLALAGAGASLTDQACLAATTYVGRRLPGLCRLGLLGIACVSARVCYAVATAPPAHDVTPVPGPAPAAPPASAIWMTSDGGASWARQPVPPGVTCTAGDCGNVLYRYPLEWVSCLGSGLCRAGGGHFLGCGYCGWAYAVLAAARPGAPWTLLTCPGPKAACSTFSPDAGDCPTSTLCYGVSWTSPFVDFDPYPSTSVSFSTDGGADWSAVPSGSSTVRNGLACPTAQTCYTVGNHGTITQTARTAFVAEPSPASRDLYGISCVDAAICYAVGANGTILARR